MATQGNSSTDFYKRTIIGLLSQLGRSLGRIFELEDDVALANQEITRLHVENAQLREEISVLRNRNDNLASSQVLNTSMEAIHLRPSTSTPESAQDRVDLHHATRRSK